ncbi:primary replicative DNA helicase [Caminicella sporogenes DSM 14501]|uniref:Replicative DNA helicase n=1 Tax=Caminicella sporogenes DSM 14501 TaxID=1121266 RepID=A0A1M6NGD3_9FIRM|nr:replicative DNA helicase [Caminicella sporogenes]RKD22212.1 replicative DNA helicase [Caminicella sporogenes]WIF95832.1 replicative DNA helicase [Caminicella sporogenes]SHJ94702.1 primary replicative DNA helicase [Caminicella sporogenes DSM 14501]
MELELLGKVPPHNIEAEQSVLGAMILDKDAIITVTEILKADDFYKEAHREIYEAILDIYNRNEPVDLVTLSEELRQRGTLDALGGVTYLSDLSTSGILTSNAKYYAKIVSEKSLLRKLIHVSTQIAQKGYESEEAEALLDLAEKSIFDISQKRNQEGFTHIKDVLLDTFDKIEQLYTNKGGITGLTTGFVDLDRKTSGLQKSDLILIAARPSMGKTAFSINICQNAAIRAKASVAIFSLEMSKEQLVQRMLSSEAHIEIQKIRNGTLSEDEWPKLASAMGPLAKAKIFIDDTPGINVMEIRAKCRRLKMEHGLDLIMIDYLQLMSSHGRAESRQQEISKISRALKILAREMDCPVIALSQLSRAPELRADHRPILSDLRESGAIEQDADVVMFLYRDEYYHPDSDRKNIGEVIIAKQRNGPTGTVELAWLGQYTKFANLEKYRE